MRARVRARMRVEVMRDDARWGECKCEGEEEYSELHTLDCPSIKLAINNKCATTSRYRLRKCEALVRFEVTLSCESESEVELG